MKSPVSNLPVQLNSELEKITFKKAIVQIDYHFYFCTTTGDKFVTTELDELNFQALENRLNPKN